MLVLKKIIATFLIIVLMGCFLPTPQWMNHFVWAASTAITEHPIETTSTPDEVVATATVKKSNWVLWSLIGVVLVGGIAAIAGSGGGGSGGGGDDDDGPTTGTIPVEW